jgi:hypothetical protein
MHLSRLAISYDGQKALPMSWWPRDSSDGETLLNFICSKLGEIELSMKHYILQQLADLTLALHKVDSTKSKQPVDFA